MTPPAGMSLRAALLAGTALLAWPAAAGVQPAPGAQPSGGVVVAGRAAISHSATTTTITQTSPRAAIDWQGFDVGAQQSVQFHQPSASAVVLNRVAAANPSQIAGRIDANGQVILINPDGITFYRGSQINTAGFVAAAAGMSNPDVMAGKLAFTTPAAADARIVNAGTITVREAGLAALVAPQVANAGVISAKFGHVVLAGARTATLDLYGDGLLALDVSNQVVEAPAGGAAALVTNSGLIRAEGGTVQLTARAADGVVQTLVQAGGHIAAPGDGAIVLDGIGGDITVTGQLRATGPHGGQIEVLPGGTATLAASARLDASGAAGGGTVAVGTTLARAAGRPTAGEGRRAAATVVQPGARIVANATAAGAGGRVAVLAAGATTMNGTISTRGGVAGGNGGGVEVSGNVLGFAGSIDVGAAAGAPGRVLFDPATLDITAAGALGALGGNILLQAGTLLEVQTTVAFTQTANVTLQSGGNLIVDRGAALLAPQAGSSLTLQAGYGNGHVVAGQGSLLLDGATLAAPDILLAAGSGIVLGQAQIAAGTLDLGTAGGNVTQTTGALTVGLLRSSTGIAGTLLLPGTNSITTLGAVTAGGAISLDNSSPLTVGGVVAAGGGSLTGTAMLALVNTAALSLAAGGTLAADAVALTAAAITQTSGRIIANTVTAAATAGTVALASTANSIGRFGNVTADGGDVVLADGQNTTIEGSIAGTNLLLDAALQGGTLALGNGSGATLTPAAGGRLSLIADNFTAGTLTVLGAAGTVELAPFSATAERVYNTLTSRLTTAGTLVIGRATPLFGLGSAVAAGVTIVNALNLTNVAPVLDLASSAGISQTGDGQISAGTLVSSSGITGTVVLGNPRNAIGVLGPFAVSGGNLTLDSSHLTLTGAISVDPAHTLALGSPGTVQEAAVTLSAGTLAGFGTIGGDLLLGGGSNSFVTLGSLAVGGNVVLADSRPLAIAGPLTAAAASFSVATLTEAGTAAISLGTLAGSGTVFALGGTRNAIAAIGSLDLAGGALTLGDRGAVTLAGPLTAASATLAATTLDEAAGALLSLGTLAGSFGTGTLAGQNRIATLGSLVLTGDLVLTDSGALHVSGPVTAVSATLAADTLTLAGNVSLASTGTLALASSGTVQQSGGVLIAGTLAGSGLIGGDLLLGSPGNRLSVLGGLAVGGAVSLADSLPLAITGPFSAAAAGFTVATLSEASGAIISLGTLTGSGTAFTLGAAQNRIATLGSLTLTRDLTLADGGALRVTGPLVAADATLAAATLTLAGSISLAAGGVLALASSGTMQESGATLIAGTLAGAGTIGGDLLLDGGSNSFATLGSLTVGGAASLADTGPLSIAGPFTAGSASFSVATLTEAAGAAISLGTLTAGGTVLDLAGAQNRIATLGTVALPGGNLTLADSGALAVTGTVTAAGVALQAATLGITGSIAATTVALSAGAGGITESSGGRLLATTLTSPGGVAGNADFAGTANAVATLSGFTAAGALVLQDSGAASLTLAGLVGGTSVVLTSGSGGILLAGTLAAGTLAPGSAGGVQEAGATLLLGTLESGGGIAGAVVLAGTANSIATLGSLTAAGGLTLADTTALTLAGRVAAPVIDLSTPGNLIETADGGLTALILISSHGIGGVVSLAGTANAVATLGPISAAALTLADTTALTVSGPVTAAGVTLAAPAITLPAAGVLGAPGATIDLSSSGSVIEATAATLTAARLQTAGGIAGDALLAGTANAIGTLGAFAVGGTLWLAEPGTLAIAGPVMAGSATLGTAALTLATGGTLGALGTLDLTTTQGGLIEATGARLLAGTLASPGGIAGDATLAGSANAIATLGGIAVAGTLALADAAALTVGGPLSAAAIRLDDAVGIGIGGVVAAGALLELSAGAGGVTEAAAARISATTLTSSGGIAGDARLAGTANAIATLDTGAVAGTLALTDSTALTLAGTLTAASLLLATPGDVQETGGAVLTLGRFGSIGTLGGSVTLTGSANAIATLGGVQIAGSLALADAVPLTIAGPLTAAGGIALAAPAITLPGGAAVAAPVVVLAGGSVTEAAGATLTVGTLTGSGVLAGNVVLAGSANAVAALDGLAAGGSVTLVDATALTIADTLAAPRIVIDSPASSVTLAAGTTLLTDGGPAPAGGAFGNVIPPTAAAGGGGAYFTVGTLIQNGRVDVAALSGGSSLLRIDAGTGGSIALDRSLGLFGADTWLVLGLAGGEASGNLFVRSLSVIYAPGLPGTTAALFGTLNQVGGEAAAGAGSIAPVPDPAIRLNDCPVHAIDCVLLPVQTVPVASPLQNFAISTLPNRGEEDDLLLPIVSGQDF